MTLNERFRELPSVDEILNSIGAEYPRELVAAETRRVLDEMRARLRSGERPDIASIPERVLQALSSLERQSLRPVINATGVILHTNLGRAPLPDVQSIPGYSNLEYDIEAGRRGKRDTHIAPLLERLLGKPGIAVNNNAAAVYLVLNELAAGQEVIVSRGELIEIGDGFRIPEIMARSGAIPKEVGTTNKTNTDDYRNAISERTRLILRVHPSNFRMEGFTSKPPLAELANLASEHGIPLYEDLGSGCVVNLSAYGVHEPEVRDSLAAGVNVVSFSGDKLLGGPQAGVLAGDSGLVARLRRNPMYWALRLDKLILQVLEQTLQNLLFGRWEKIPTLRMIVEPADTIRRRAEALAVRLPKGQCPIREGKSVIGGGATPMQELPTWLLVLEGEATSIERRLRACDPPVVARIEDDLVVLDLRTVAPSEDETVSAALRDMCAAG